MKKLTKQQRATQEYWKRYRKNKQNHNPSKSSIVLTVREKTQILNQREQAVEYQKQQDDYSIYKQHLAAARVSLLAAASVHEGANHDAIGQALTALQRVI